MYASVKGDINVVNLLISAGASINVKETTVNYIHFYMYHLHMCSFDDSLLAIE